MAIFIGIYARDIPTVLLYSYDFRSTKFSFLFITHTTWQPHVALLVSSHMFVLGINNGRVYLCNCEINEGNAVGIEESCGYGQCINYITGTD